MLLEGGPDASFDIWISRDLETSQFLEDAKSGCIEPLAAPLWFVQ